MQRSSRLRSIQNQGLELLFVFEGDAGIFDFDDEHVADVVVRLHGLAIDDGGRVAGGENDALEFHIFKTRFR